MAVISFCDSVHTGFPVCSASGSLAWLLESLRWGTEVIEFHRICCSHWQKSNWHLPCGCHHRWKMRKQSKCWNPCVSTFMYVWGDHCATNWPASSHCRNHSHSLCSPCHSPTLSKQAYQSFGFLLTPAGSETVCLFSLLSSVLNWPDCIHVFSPLQLSTRH